VNHEQDHDGNQSEMLSNIQTLHTMDDPSNSLFVNEPFLGDESGSGEHPGSIDDSLIMDENRRTALDNGAAMNPNSAIFEEDPDLMADHTTLLELADADPPEHSKEDDQMLVDELVIVNDRYSKGRSPEPFFGDESTNHEPHENNVSIIDNSSIPDGHARRRQNALDNVAAMNKGIEEHSDLVMVDTALPQRFSMPQKRRSRSPHDRTRVCFMFYCPFMYLTSDHGFGFLLCAKGFFFQYFVSHCAR